MTPTFPRAVLDLPDIGTDSAVAVEPSPESFRASIARAAYEEAGIGPEDLSLAEVYDLHRTGVGVVRGHRALRPR
ncbi:hypothetical protein [Streptomyces sp. NPDC088706]|uniref:hypothetical protein n=1 Tax=Streptomyces sp. NPDC088706 TaxID=3365870 RepID=UPI0037FBB31E